MPFTLGYNRPRNTLFIAFSGALTSEDHHEMVAAACAFIARNGPCNAITDLTAVEAFRLPLEYVKAFARKSSVLAGQKRVIVAPTDELFGMMRLFEMHQSSTGNEPLVVRTMGEALAHFGMAAPDFQPIVLK